MSIDARAPQRDNTSLIFGQFRQPHSSNVSSVLLADVSEACGIILIIAAEYSRSMVRMKTSHTAILIFFILCNTGVSMAGQHLIELPQPSSGEAGSLVAALQNRRSVRSFKSESLTVSSIARLLWAAQGVTSDEGLRTAPSAGALYPLELHLVAGKVNGLPAGSYRYDPRRHALHPEVVGDQRTNIAAAAMHQNWIAQAAAIVVVTAFDVRTTRKYGVRGVRYIHIEVGHASQNLLLQATALGLATTIVGGFDDDALAGLLNLADGERPLAILAVGHPRE